jgi:hypothetical protein
MPAVNRTQVVLRCPDHNASGNLLHVILTSKLHLFLWYHFDIVLGIPFSHQNFIKITIVPMISLSYHFGITLISLLQLVLLCQCDYYSNIILM